ncbi:MAG: hypothetical protein JO112_12300 [Planctomycetes bacterium]|nr:hypothetical protein [Planctomycetota bacterium]
MSSAAVRWVAAGLLGLLVPAAAHASPALTTTSTGNTTTFGSGSVGWAFTTGPTSVTVIALDAILQGQSSANVRLYDSSGTTLTSATVTTADPTETAGLTWYSQSITPFTLAANTTYYIAQDVTGGTVYIKTSTPTMTNGMTYIGGVATNFGTGQNPTSDVARGGNDPAYFGPNFDPMAPVPEPSVYAMITACGAALGSLRLWRRLRPGRPRRDPGWPPRRPDSARKEWAGENALSPPARDFLVHLVDGEVASVTNPPAVSMS